MAKLWHNEMRLGGALFVELRIDFDNGRHHAVRVEPPHDARCVAYALRVMADQIAHDPHLSSNAALTGHRPKE